MSDGGTTVAIVLAGVLGATLAWIGVHFCRKWIKQRHAEIQREDFQKEMQAAQAVERGRDRKRKRRPKESRKEREPPEWQPPIPDARLAEECMTMPQHPPQPQYPVEEIPSQPARSDPVQVDYIVEADEMPEVIAGLQGCRTQKRDSRSCSTESSSSSSSSEEAARSSRKPDVTREIPRDFGLGEYHQHALPPRKTQIPRIPTYHAEGYEFGMPQMPQGIRGGGHMGRSRRRYGATNMNRRRNVLNQPNKMGRRLTPSNTPL